MTNSISKIVILMLISLVLLAVKKSIILFIFCFSVPFILCVNPLLLKLSPWWKNMRDSMVQWEHNSHVSSILIIPHPPLLLLSNPLDPHLIPLIHQDLQTPHHRLLLLLLRPTDPQLLLISPPPLLLPLPLSPPHGL